MEASWEGAIQFRQDGDSIVMGGRNLGDEGALSWARWARDRPKTHSKPINNLRLVDFSENCLSDRGVRAIVAVLLQLHPETRILKLFRNNISGSEEVTPLIQLGRLDELHLSHNKLTAESITDVVLQVKAAGYPHAGKAPFWLRVEHNVRDGDQRLAHSLRPLRRDICVVDGKTACHSKWCCQGGHKTAAVHLTHVDLHVSTEQPTQQLRQKSDKTVPPVSITKTSTQPPARSVPGKNQTEVIGYDWLVDNFPTLAGPVPPQLSSIGLAWAKSAACSGIQPPAGSVPGQKRTAVLGYEWSVEDFPTLAGPASLQLSPMGLAWTESAACSGTLVNAAREFGAALLPVSAIPTPLRSDDATPLRSDDATPLRSDDATPLQSDDATPLQSDDATPLQSEDAMPLQGEDATPLQSDDVLDDIETHEKLQVSKAQVTQNTSYPTSRHTCEDYFAAAGDVTHGEELETRGSQQTAAPPPCLPTSCVVEGTHFWTTARYDGERGGFLSLQLGARGVVMHVRIEKGEAKDLWPSYVFARETEGGTNGWFPWALCELEDYSPETQRKP